MTLDAAEQKLVDDVAQHGWHIVRVSSAVGESELPPFAYTVGLQVTFGWPELLCYGLAPKTMSAMLNNAVAELRMRAEPPAEGLMLRDVVEGFECRLARMAKRHFAEHLGFAMWFARYRGHDPRQIECLQLLWPDRHGHFPDEHECSAGLRELQPVLAD